RPEPERVHEVPRDRAGARVARVAQLLPARRSRSQHENPLPVAPDPDRLVRGASYGQDMDPEPGGVRKRGECLRVSGRCQGEQQWGRPANPQSAIRNPQSTHPRAVYTVGISLISVTSTRGACVTAYSTAAATSSACNMALRLVKPGFESGSTGSQIGVSTGPGETSVVRTPVRARSWRSTSCMPRRPYLLAAYAVEPEYATWSDTEPIVTRCPVPRCTRCGTNARATRNGPVRLTAMVRWNSSRLVSSMRLMKKVPALLTTTSGT